MHLLTAPVVTIADDNESKYKIQGIKLIQSLLIKCSFERLNSMGLCHVFENVLYLCLILQLLENCLVYRQEDSIEAELLAQSFKCYLELADQMQKTSTQESERILKKTLQIGLLTNYIYIQNKGKALVTAIEYCLVIVEKLGYISIIYLQVYLLSI